MTVRPPRPMAEPKPARPDYQAGFDGRCTMCGETGLCPECEGEADGCTFCDETGECPECGGTGVLSEANDED